MKDLGKSKTLRLGTRKSLLAVAQASMVKAEIERREPGLSVELVGIETEGDRISDRPLSQIGGKDFFAKEIDDALLKGRVDLTVHSAKDLSLTRSSRIQLAAVSRRENPRDLVVFNSRVKEKLRWGRRLRIGTSSPRRLENVPGFLKSGLPRSEHGGEPDLEFVEIRGNVNTRLGRLRLDPTDPRYLDGVVLAFAGLSRLWAHSVSREEILKQGLLRDVLWMMLPLRECPAAPGQGALVLECRRGDDRVLDLAQRLHDEKSAAELEKERLLMAAWGGGCYQRFGITAVEHPRVGGILYARGVLADGSPVELMRWDDPLAERPKVVGKDVAFWDGSQYPGRAEPLTVEAPPKASAWFVSHHQALPKTWAHYLKDSENPVRVWVPGVATWFRLASEGVWIEGCTEGLGFDCLEEWIASPLLQLPALSDWALLTHEGASDSVAQRVTTYRLNFDLNEHARITLKRASHVFWSSGRQFDAYGPLITNHKDVIHACGAGRTAQALTSSGIGHVNVFPSVKEWREWINRSV